MSRGMGFPSAVEGIKDAEEVFAGPEKRGGKESGNEFRRMLDARERKSFEGVDEIDEVLGGGAWELVWNRATRGPGRTERPWSREDGMAGCSGDDSDGC